MKINLKECMENVRANTPLVHNITNYVTVNDCANILLACGASPIMSDDINDVEDITSICSGLNINIGTLNGNTIPSMFAAGKKANQLSHPVLLDPVGAGASDLRTKTSLELLNQVQFTAIRGNISEIKVLASGSGNTRGVDADISDTVTKDNIKSIIEFAKEFARKTNSIIVITGATDIITDGEKAVCVYNGDASMSKITGTGCQLSAMMTAYICANPENVFDACCTAVIAMGVCGEIAKKRMTADDGNSSYRNYIIDAIYNLDSDKLERWARYDIC